MNVRFATLYGATLFGATLYGWCKQATPTKAGGFPVPDRGGQKTETMNKNCSELLEFALFPLLDPLCGLAVSELKVG